MDRRADLQERRRLLVQLEAQQAARVQELSTVTGGHTDYRRGRGQLTAPGWGPALCRLELVRAELREVDRKLAELPAPEHAAA